MNSIFHRVSIRRYQDQPVEKEKIELLMRAGMAAPSAMNQQPWEFYVLRTGKQLRPWLPAAGTADSPLRPR